MYLKESIMKLIFLLLIFSNSNLFSVEPIKKSILIETAWGPDRILGEGWILEFDYKNIYTERWLGEGCGGYQGSWKIIDNILVLEPDKNPECTPNNKPPKKRMCSFEKTDSSIYYVQRLNCGNNEYFWDLKNAIEKGAKRTFEGIEIHTLGLEKAIANSNVKFRIKPNTKSKTIKCSIQDNLGGQKEIDYIPKGIEIYLIGRTNEKEKVEKWENYWYLVSMSSNSYNACFADAGWVYGEFLEIK